MKPLDPRLVRRARSVRLPLGLNVGIGVLQTAAVVAQASLLAQVIANAVTRHASLNHEGGRLLALLLVVGARATLAYGAEIVGRVGATRVKSELRAQLLERTLGSAPSRLAEGRTGELAALAGQGLDALDVYFSHYLPQLVLAAIVPPAVVVVAAARDVASAVVLVVTVALIPLFLVLVGLATRDRTERQWRALSRLGAHLLDVIEGLPTLRIFGRAGHQRAVISEMAEEHRVATMGVLRLAFTSSLVTELIATVGTAIVAVTVGLRVLDGALDLHTALFVLLLAPEAYMPVRAVGAAFHASAEGATAAQQALDLLDEPPTPRPATPEPAPSGPWTIRMDGVSLTWPDRPSPALDHLDLVIGPGEHLAVVGPSGAGKSTFLGLLLGFVRPTQGLVSVGGVDLDRLDIDEWRRHIAWVPQRPHLFAATIADNIRLGRPAADDDAVRAAARAAGALAFIDRLPLGLRTPVGDGGARLSGGEAQRIALARAFLRDAPVVLLDEPTASLDAATEREVLVALEALIAGRIAIIVTHREAPTTLADTVVALDRGCLSSISGTSCLAETR